MTTQEPSLGPLLAEGRTAEVYAWGEDQILKLYREGWPKENVEHEHRKALASQQTGFSVPMVGELIELDGRYGLVFQRVEGKTLLTLLQTRPWQVFRYAKTMARLQTDMHTRTAAGLPNLHNNLKRKIEGTDKLDETIKQVLYDHLAQLPQDNKLCHGDFHPDNILMTKNGTAIPHNGAVVIDLGRRRSRPPAG